MAGSEAPPFWYQQRSFGRYALAPVSWLYGAVARWRMDRARPPAVMAPVLCIGNLTVGGSGKTPTAIAMAKAVRAAGYSPGFLTRGYGGSHAGPHMVDLEADTAMAVGDEPLLLARVAPTVVAHNRAAGAQYLVDRGIDFMIMDDGFQSRRVHFDYALIALDARRGIGNGAVIPAGPLRAPLIDQMRHADALLRIGDGPGGIAVVRAASRAAKPILRADFVPEPLEGLEGRSVLAYSGIADPSKFYETLTAAGYTIGAKRSFGDHHVFTEGEAAELLAMARAENLVPVTTEKDIVRLTRLEGPVAELRAISKALPVDLVFENQVVLASLIEDVAKRYHKRRITG
ncbi:tetraacyldisaccharide 4'-kinase [Oricola sp.]|uniref:tetraacyldisaccharide 4'-kinase n=1 Tax=Oricola sp. TaxID=1979950 RepID=UPI0025E507D8|nr:tetraacyldisaccharide 4'-kinase [Oricola sp.]MCI5078540.1 tetraacyldisaccharide 4'-kinase [Oricola sp.]